VQLEAVGRVAVGDLCLEVGRQVDDVDGVKGTFLRANATSYAQSFGDEGDPARGVDLDAELAGTNDRAGLLAFLPAFLRLAWSILSAFADFRSRHGEHTLVRIDNSDTIIPESVESHF